MASNISGTSLPNHTPPSAPSYFTPELERLAKQVAWVTGGFASLAYAPAPFSLIGFTFSIYQAFGSPNQRPTNNPSNESPPATPQRSGLKHTISKDSMASIAESVEEWMETVPKGEVDVISIDGTTTHTAVTELHEQSIEDLDDSLGGSDQGWQAVRPHLTSEKKDRK